MPRRKFRRSGSSESRSPSINWEDIVVPSDPSVEDAWRAHVPISATKTVELVVTKNYEDIEEDAGVWFVYGNVMENGRGIVSSNMTTGATKTEAFNEARKMLHKWRS